MDFDWDKLYVGVLDYGEQINITELYYSECLSNCGVSEENLQDYKTNSKDFSATYISIDINQFHLNQYMSLRSIQIKS